MNLHPDRSQGRERSLKRKAVMDRVFAVGHTAKSFPLLSRFGQVAKDGPAPTRVAFTVSKKRFRRAVDRNRIKRLMRESWRNLRSPFEELVSDHEQCAVVLIFVGKDIPSQEAMDKAMSRLLPRMKEALTEAT